MSEITIKVNGSAAMTPALVEDLGPQSMLSDRETKNQLIVTPIESMVASTGEILPSEARYASSDAISRAFGTALKLLREAEVHADRAISLARESDHLGADDAIYAIKPLLPELFCCRQLGDGFGLIISGLLSAFQNLSGQPMGFDQIMAVSACVSKLRQQPRIALDLADHEMETLEGVGLNPDPAGIEELVGAITPDDGNTSD